MKLSEITGGITAKEWLDKFSMSPYEDELLDDIKEYDNSLAGDDAEFDCKGLEFVAPPFDIATDHCDLINFEYNPNLNWDWMKVQQWLGLYGNIGNLLSDWTLFEHNPDVHLAFHHEHGKIENLTKVFDFGESDLTVWVEANEVLIKRQQGVTKIGSGYKINSYQIQFRDFSKNGAVINDAFDMQDWLVSNGRGSLA